MDSNPSRNSRSNAGRRWLAHIYRHWFLDAQGRDKYREAQLRHPSQALPRESSEDEDEQ